MEFITIKKDDNINHIFLKGNLDKERTDQIDLDFSLNIFTYKKPTLINISNVDYISSLGL